MSKAEPARRRELIGATLDAIGDQRSLDVTVSNIAGRAGVSAALVHHYFGSKDDLLEATMRHLLVELGDDLVMMQRGARGPRERLETIVKVCFSRTQFRPSTVAVWLAFYAEAQRTPRLHRLLSIYLRRLRSNLLHEFRFVMTPSRAALAADVTGALIDGLYLRQALNPQGSDPEAAERVALMHLDDLLEQSGQKAHGRR